MIALTPRSLTRLCYHWDWWLHSSFLYKLLQEATLPAPTIAGLPFDNLNRQISSYSCTFGESFRSNNSYFSISTGISFNSYFGSLPIPDGTFPFDYYKYEFKGENVISVPIEFRTNALAINGIGIGLYLNINLISKDEHTYFMYGGINLVLGYWNKTKRNSQIKQTHM